MYIKKKIRRPAPDFSPAAADKPLCTFRSAGFTHLQAPAAHCHARQTGKSSRCCTEKLTITVLSGACHIPRVPRFAANAPLSGVKESWGVARGDRKPWCPIPFCPSPREGRVPARRSVRNSLPPKAAITIPPRAGFRLRRRTAVSAEPLPSADGKNAACARFCPCPGGHIPVGDYSHFSQTSGQYPTVA